MPDGMAFAGLSTTTASATGTGTARKRGRFRTRTLTSPLALALEPRFMFDAAGVATGGEAAVDAAAQEAGDQQTDNPQPEDQTDPLAEALSATPPPADRNEVVFVDPSIDNVDALLSGVHPAAEVVVLDPTGDGLQQIADYLADKSDIDAVHILSHGRAGSVTLGGLTLDLAAVEARATDLATIGDALTADGDVLIYGCDAAAGAAGAAFVDALAQATGADVAASTDDTGHADRGGDWDLEHRTGTIEADLAVAGPARADFAGLLATSTVFEVNTTEDGIDVDGLSLREALADAKDGDTITFADTIDTITLTKGELFIRQGVTIDGDLNDDETADVTLDGGGVTRIFFISTGGTDVTLDGLVIQNGFASSGGGVFVNGGEVTITNSTLSGNTASDGGGGIFNNANSTLTLANSTLSGNTANNGGGIFNNANSTLTLANSTLSGNTAAGGFGGGGIFNNANSTLTLANSTLSGNTAAGGYGGGGIFTNVDSTVTLVNATLSGNTAVSTIAGGGGGGIFNIGGGELTLVNSTLSGNSTGDSGGGINNFSGNLTLVNSTLSGNSANNGGGIFVNGGTVVLNNSIVAGNAAEVGVDIGGTITSNGANIFGSDVDGAVDNEDIVLGVDYTLGDVFANVGSVTVGDLTFEAGLLADNGGPVRTIALDHDSVIAIDTGDPDALDEGETGLDLNGDGGTDDVILTDARGRDRTSGAGVDIGAFELRSIVVDTTQDIVDGGDGKTSLREALAAADDGDAILFDETVFTTGDGTITLTLGQELAVRTGVTIAGDIDGDGIADVTVDGGRVGDVGGVRVFNILEDVTGVALDGLVIQNGFSTGNGGGIFIDRGAQVTITNSTLSGNTAGGFGGGIFINRDAQVTITNSTLSGNTASNVSGGGIFINRDAQVTINNSTLSGNTAGGFGGGISSLRGALTLENSTLTGNSANSGGGGIHNGGGGAILTLVNSTLSGNSTSGFGGGIFNNDSATLTNTTLSGNKAAFGGGIFNGGTLHLNNSIVAGNAAGTDDDIGGTITSNGANIFGSAVDGAVDNEDIVLGVDNDFTLDDVFADVGSVTVGGRTFEAGVLADNGGPVQTITLDPYSIAIDAGNGDDLDGDISTDARGRDRVSGDEVDIGAVELSRIIVDTPEDEVADDAFTSLREALAQATAEDAEVDTIVFDKAVFLDNGRQTITLSEALGDLQINTGVIIDGDIDGDGIADVTVDGGRVDDEGGVRVFSISANVTGVALHGLVIQNGFADGSGGGLRVGNDASVAISHTTFSGNTAGDIGGAIDNSNGTLTLTNTTISGNTAGANGGAIDTFGGSLTLINTIISGNTAGENGGAIDSFNSSLTLINTTISGNTAGENGGAIDNSGGSLTLINTTISGNTAGEDGGAIDNSTGIVTLTNTTISGNTAVEDGGAIDNSAGTLTLNNSIVAGNAAGTNDDIRGSITSNGANIFGSDVDGAVDNEDIVLGVDNDYTLRTIFADVGSVTLGDRTFDAGVLRDNGGPVQTIALNPDGIAVDRGRADVVDGVATDARGFARNTERPGVGNEPPPNTVDIGAFEVQEPPTVVDDTFETDEDTPLTENVLTNSAGGADTDPDGGTLRVFADELTTANGGTVVLSANGDFTYTPAADFNGTDSFDYRVLGSQGGLATGTGTITVVPVNDDPTISGVPNFIEVAEDTITGTDGSFTLVLEDVDAADGRITLTIGARLGTLTADGTATVEVAGSGTGTLDLTGTVAELNAFLATPGSVAYLGSPDVNGVGADLLTLTANDGGNTGQGGGNDVFLDTTPVNITPVNDAPTIAGAPGPVEVFPTDSVTFTGLTIADVEDATNPGGTYTVTLTVGSGSLAVATAVPGVTVATAGSGTLTLEGALADINAVLAGGIVFTAPPVFDGAEVTFAATVSDNGNAGGGGPLTDALAFPITVADSPDPVIPGTTGSDGAGDSPTAAGNQTGGEPGTTLDATGGAPEVSAQSLTGGALTGDLDGPAAGEPATPTLFGIPVGELAAGLLPGTELGGFASAAELLASLEPAAGQDALPVGEVDLDLHGFPVDELALYLVGSFELSAIDSREGVLALVAAATDGGTVAERFAVLQMLERLGLFADGSVTLAELGGEIDLFGMSLGALADALDGIDLDSLATLADLQAVLDLPATAAATGAQDATAAATGAPAFTAQIAGAFDSFDREAATLGAALAQIPAGGTHRLAA